MNFLAGDIVKGALRAVHHDGDIGGELGGDAAGLGGAGGDGREPAVRAAQSTRAPARLAREFLFIISFLLVSEQ